MKLFSRCLDGCWALTFNSQASIVNMLACFLVVFRLGNMFVAYLAFPPSLQSDVLIPNFFFEVVPAKTIGLSGCLSGCTGPLCQPIFGGNFGCHSFFWRPVRANCSIRARFFTKQLDHPSDILLDYMEVI